MIFAAAATEPTMFLFLSEEDVQSIKEGRTKFVDQRATKGFRFDKVIVAYCRTNAEAIALIERGQAAFQNIQEHRPEANEKPCNFCQSLIPEPQMFEGRCIVCWATLAKHHQKKESRPS